MESLKQKHLKIRTRPYPDGLGIRKSLSLYPAKYEDELPKIKELLEHKNYRELSKIPHFANMILAAYLKYYSGMEAEAAEIEIENIVQTILRLQEV